MSVLTTASFFTGNIGIGYQVTGIAANTTDVFCWAFQHRGTGVLSAGSIFVVIENTSIKQHALIGWVKCPVGAV